MARKSKKQSKKQAESTTVTESTAAAPAAEPVTAAAAEPVAEPTPAAKPAKAAKPPKAPREPKVKAPPPVSDYMICVGGEFYKTIDDFISEAATLGVSRRMPTHNLPGGLALVGSRIWLAHGCGRKGESATIFGYFKPTGIEFIAGPDGASKYADVIAELKLKPGAKIIKSVKGEAARKCGHRKVGGTYVVAEKGSAENPVVRTPDQPFVGHTFRGLMRITPEQSAALDAGAGLKVLTEETCMVCGAKTIVAPDSVKIKAKVLRQQAKGIATTWLLRCRDCMKKHLAEKRAERLAAAAAAAPATPAAAPATEVK